MVSYYAGTSGSRSNAPSTTRPTPYVAPSSPSRSGASGGGSSGGSALTPSPAISPPPEKVAKSTSIITKEGGGAFVRTFYAGGGSSDAPLTSANLPANAPFVMYGTTNQQGVTPAFNPYAYTGYQPKGMVEQKTVEVPVRTLSQPERSAPKPVTAEEAMSANRQRLAVSTGLPYDSVTDEMMKRAGVWYTPTPTQPSAPASVGSRPRKSFGFSPDAAGARAAYWTSKDLEKEYNLLAGRIKGVETLGKSVGLGTASDATYEAYKDLSGDLQKDIDAYNTNATAFGEQASVFNSNVLAANRVAAKDFAKQRANLLAQGYKETILPGSGEYVYEKDSTSSPFQLKPGSSPKEAVEMAVKANTVSLTGLSGGSKFSAAPFSAAPTMEDFMARPNKAAVVMGLSEFEKKLMLERGENEAALSGPGLGPAVLSFSRYGAQAGMNVGKTGYFKNLDKSPYGESLQTFVGSTFALPLGLPYMISSSGQLAPSRINAARASKDYGQLVTTSALVDYASSGMAYASIVAPVSSLSFAAKTASTGTVGLAIPSAARPVLAVGAGATIGAVGLLYPKEYAGLAAMGGAFGAAKFATTTGARVGKEIFARPVEIEYGANLVLVETAKQAPSSVFTIAAKQGKSASVSYGFNAPEAGGLYPELSGIKSRGVITPRVQPKMLVGGVEGIGEGYTVSSRDFGKVYTDVGTGTKFTVWEKPALKSYGVDGFEFGYGETAKPSANLPQVQSIRYTGSVGQGPRTGKTVYYSEGLDAMGDMVYTGKARGAVYAVEKPSLFENTVFKAKQSVAGITGRLGFGEKSLTNVGGLGVTKTPVGVYNVKFSSRVSNEVKPVATENFGTIQNAEFETKITGELKLSGKNGPVSLAINQKQVGVNSEVFPLSKETGLVPAAKAGRMLALDYEASQPQTKLILESFTEGTLGGKPVASYMESLKLGEIQTGSKAGVAEISGGYSYAKLGNKYGKGTPSLTASFNVAGKPVQTFEQWGAEIYTSLEDVTPTKGMASVGPRTMRYPSGNPAASGLKVYLPQRAVMAAIAPPAAVLALPAPLFYTGGLTLTEPGGMFVKFIEPGKFTANRDITAKALQLPSRPEGKITEIGVGGSGLRLTQLTITQEKTETKTIQKPRTSTETLTGYKITDYDKPYSGQQEDKGNDIVDGGKSKEGEMLDWFKTYNEKSSIPPLTGFALAGSGKAGYASSFATDYANKYGGGQKTVSKQKTDTAQGQRTWTEQGQNVFTGQRQSGKQGQTTFTGQGQTTFTGNKTLTGQGQRTWSGVGQATSDLFKQPSLQKQSTGTMQKTLLRQPSLQAQRVGTLSLTGLLQQQASPPPSQPLKFRRPPPPAFAFGFPSSGGKRGLFSLKSKKRSGEGKSGTRLLLPDLFSASRSQFKFGSATSQRVTKSVWAQQGAGGRLATKEERRHGFGGLVGALLGKQKGR